MVSLLGFEYCLSVAKTDNETGCIWSMRLWLQIEQWANNRLRLPRRRRVVTAWKVNHLGRSARLLLLLLFGWLLFLDTRDDPSSAPRLDELNRRAVWPRVFIIITTQSVSRCCGFLHLLLSPLRWTRTMKHRWTPQQQTTPAPAPVHQRRRVAVYVCVRLQWCVPPRGAFHYLSSFSSKTHWLQALIYWTQPIDTHTAPVPVSACGDNNNNNNKNIERDDRCVVLLLPFLRLMCSSVCLSSSECECVSICAVYRWFRWMRQRQRQRLYCTHNESV